MSMMRYDPIGPMTSLREAIDRLFEESFVRPSAMQASARTLMPIDMYETEDAIVISAPLPGVLPEDLEVTVTGDMVTIRARITSEAESEEASRWNWIMHEVPHGELTRTFSLPTLVECDRADAQFLRGLLRLSLPKAESTRPRQIKVSAAERMENMGPGATESFAQMTAQPVEQEPTTGGAFLATEGYKQQAAEQAATEGKHDMPADLRQRQMENLEEWKSREDNKELGVEYQKRATGQESKRAGRRADTDYHEPMAQPGPPISRQTIPPETQSEENKPEERSELPPMI
jgi:HSP20 family protein